MAWAWFIAGLFIGSIFGLFCAALCRAAKDREMINAIDHGRGFRENVAALVAKTREHLSPLNKKRQSILLTPDQCPNCFNRGAKPIYGWMQLFKLHVCCSPLVPVA